MEREPSIALQVDGETVTGTLFGNAASRSLIEQFPLTLTFLDHGGQAMNFYPFADLGIYLSKATAGSPSRAGQTAVQKR
ncbi:cyclophilin-like fold protein [Paenarthrobacter aromaticivorans]|uniref:cyclophilin-like fold protein n=1 Tax=Paenarthrobacter aromaticivorans TaxID=2849150 RepID=UPI003A806BCC